MGYEPEDDFENMPSIWKSTTAVMYSQDGQHLLANSTPGKIRLYDVNSQKVIQSYYGNRNIMTVKGVSFYGRNDEYVLSGSDDGRMYFWDKLTGELVNTGVGDEGLGTSEGVVNCIVPHN